MKITPLVILGQLRIPAFTDAFGDTIAIASMSVAQGGLITLDCSAPHNVVVGDQVTVSIVDALTPNPITALAHVNAGTANDIQVTVTYPHNLTASSDNHFAQYQGFATLAGLGVAGLTGAIQLVAPIIDRYNFIVRPFGAVTLPGSIPAGSALLEDLEHEIIGWNVATATDETTLTMPTPAAVSRSYTVANPKVVQNVRIMGAVDLGHALGHFTRPDERDQPVPGGCWMFITPVKNARISRDRSSVTDALYEGTPYAVMRQTLLDGFEILVIVPTEQQAAAVGAMDRCGGQILRAVLRTFNGIVIPRSEFAGPGRFVASLISHGHAGYSKANYVHRYSVQAAVQITNDDNAYGYELPDLTAIDTAIQNGDPVPTTPLLPIGSVPWELLDIDGICHDDPASQPLTATAIPMDTVDPDNPDAINP